MSVVLPKGFPLCKPVLEFSAAVSGAKVSSFYPSQHKIISLFVHTWFSLDHRGWLGEMIRDNAEIKAPHEDLNQQSAKSNKEQIENTPSLTLFLVNKIFPAR